MNSQIISPKSNIGTEIIYENGNGGGKKYPFPNLNNQGTLYQPCENIIYDVPKTNQSIYSQSKVKTTSNLVDSLVPSAAKLILRHSQSNTRSDILDRECSEFDNETLDFSENEDEDSGGSLDPEEDYRESLQNTPPKNYNYNLDHQEYENNDYGLEVIHEETESQMSSSGSEADFDSYQEDIIPTKMSIKIQNADSIKAKKQQHINYSQATEIVLGIPSSESSNNLETQETFPEEAVAKHIKISPESWDPAPILGRLYAVPEPKHLSNKEATTHSTDMRGFLNILSGNRKKGTFWNAWKRKYYVLGTGKLNGYEKEDCTSLFQSINLIGGKVDFLDPTDFVGTDQSKTMTNRIIGIDDSKGHYYVVQCQNATEAATWVDAIKMEMSPSAALHYILPKTLSNFRDIILVEFGSTNIRAGVLAHQPTLPALFFAAVMSENVNGTVVYGNEVYLRENRKNAKIKFPIECTSKMCQNNLDMTAIKGFLLKIFKELNVQPSKYRIIVTLPRRVDNACKKGLLSLLFDTFTVKSALLCHQSVVSFWAYSSDNGIICDIGERCDIVPVSHGFVLNHAWERAPFGGQPLKHCLRQGLGPQENGLYLSTPAENLVLRFITENFIYCSSQGSRKMSQDSREISVDVELDLRDVLSISNLIGVNQTVLRGVSEGFFDPGLYGLDCDSLQKLVFRSLQNCGMDIRKEMSQNIFVTGGCTMLPGFVERLEFEVTKLCPPHLKPKIQASPYRYHASYIGASALSTTDAFEKSLIHRDKYDGGSGPVHWLV